MKYLLSDINKLDPKITEAIIYDNKKLTLHNTENYDFHNGYIVKTTNDMFYHMAITASLDFKYIINNAINFDYIGFKLHYQFMYKGNESKSNIEDFLGMQVTVKTNVDGWNYADCTERITTFHSKIKDNNLSSYLSNSITDIIIPPTLLEILTNSIPNNVQLWVKNQRAYDIIITRFPNYTERIKIYSA